MTIHVKSTIKCFGGMIYRCSHKSSCLGGLEANFSVYMPEICEINKTKVPQLYFLSGLTCTDENFVSKAGALSKANELNIALIIPDTSPRKTGIEDEDKDYDLGSGASFYVNATQAPWEKFYRMYDYITEELPSLIPTRFPVLTDKVSIMGHSMGGHGALMISLKNPGKYKSVSAFAPICNPTNCTWGTKAFTAYLGEDKTKWKCWDSCELLKNIKGQDLHIFIDQGDNDEFLTGEVNQLQVQSFKTICRENKIPLIYKERKGYDHSYYYISTFINEHLEHHSRFLN